MCGLVLQSLRHSNQIANERAALRELNALGPEQSGSSRELFRLAIFSHSGKEAHTHP